MRIVKASLKTHIKTGLLALLGLPLMGLVFSIQAKEAPSEFYRLIAQNAASQILVVKIKGTDLWVTPGLYGEKDTFSLEAFDQLAAQYGLTISTPQLRGTFKLQNKEGEHLSNRHFYVASVKSGTIALPENIELAEWLDIEQAYNVINIPHINILMKHVFDYPDEIWTASVMRHRDEKGFHAAVTEPFEPLQQAQ